MNFSQNIDLERKSIIELKIVSKTCPKTATSWLQRNDKADAILEGKAALLE